MSCNAYYHLRKLNRNTCHVHICISGWAGGCKTCKQRKVVSLNYLKSHSMPVMLCITGLISITTRKLPLINNCKQTTTCSIKSGYIFQPALNSLICQKQLTFLFRHIAQFFVRLFVFKLFSFLSITSIFSFYDDLKFIS